MSAYRRHRALQDLYAQASLFDESSYLPGEPNTFSESFSEESISYSKSMPKPVQKMQPYSQKERSPI